MKTGFIYKITNSYDEKIYVGCTRINLSIRFERHLRDHKMPKKMNKGLYAHMNLLGVDKFSIHLIESVSYETDHDLFEREGHWIKELKTWVKFGGLNTIISTRTPKEWYQDTIEERRESDKRQTIKKQQRLKDDKEYRDKYNERRKEYQRRPEVKEKKKQYLKKLIYTPCKTNVRCGCGGSIGTNRYQHFMSKQHMDWLENEVRREMQNRFMMEMNDVRTI